MPTFAEGNAGGGVTSASGGATSTITDAVLVASAADPAVTVTGNAPSAIVTAGAMYLTRSPLELDAFDILPHPAAAWHVMNQLTPLLLESPVTVAVSASVCFASICRLLGLDAMLTDTTCGGGGPDGVDGALGTALPPPPPPPPQAAGVKLTIKRATAIVLVRMRRSSQGLSYETSVNAS
jgi:hypothetical protein